MVHCQARVAYTAADKGGVNHQSFNKSVVRTLHNAVAVRLLGTSCRVGAQIYKYRLTAKGLGKQKRLPRKHRRHKLFGILFLFDLNVRQSAQGVLGISYLF